MQEGVCQNIHHKDGLINPCWELWMALYINRWILCPVNTVIVITYHCLLRLHSVLVLTDKLPQTIIHCAKEHVHKGEVGRLRREP